MDFSVKIMFDVSPKLEELVFHVLAALAKAEAPAQKVEAPVQKAEAPAQKVEKAAQKAEAPVQKAEASVQKVEIPGRMLSKAEAEKVKEVADLHDSDEITESDLVSLREKVVAFVQQDAEKNKPIFARWLMDHNLKRITGIKTKALAEELEAVINAR